jgi:hypothetical protein
VGTGGPAEAEADVLDPGGVGALVAHVEDDDKHEACVSPGGLSVTEKSLRRVEPAEFDWHPMLRRDRVQAFEDRHRARGTQRVHWQLGRGVKLMTLKKGRRKRLPS